MRMSILAGFCIAIGCWVNLAVGGVAGAVLFAFGLLTVVHYKFKLFTGTAGFVQSFKEHLSLIEIIIGNTIGVCLVALIACFSPLNLDTSAIVNSRISVGWLGCGVLSIGCGFIMTTAVEHAKRGRILPLLFGVPTFILCGFPHCIADVFYYLGASMNVYECPCWYATIVGNYIGCNLVRILKPRD